MKFYTCDLKPILAEVPACQILEGDSVIITHPGAIRPHSYTVRSVKFETDGTVHIRFENSMYIVECTPDELITKNTQQYEKERVYYTENTPTSGTIVIGASAGSGAY